MKMKPAQTMTVARILRALTPWQPDHKVYHTTTWAILPDGTGGTDWGAIALAVELSEPAGVIGQRSWLTITVNSRGASWIELGASSRDADLFKPLVEFGPGIALDTGGIKAAELRELRKVWRAAKYHYEQHCGRKPWTRRWADWFATELVSKYQYPWEKARFAAHLVVSIHFHSHRPRHELHHRISNREPGTVVLWALGIARPDAC